MFHPVSLRRRSLRDRMTETTHSKLRLSDLSRQTLTSEEFTVRLTEALLPDFESFLRSSNLPFALDAYVRSQSRRIMN